MNQLMQGNKALMIVFGLLLLMGCSGQHIDDYSDTSPDFDVISFFSGDLEVKGVVMNRSGEVTRRFSVKMLGSVEDNTLTLEEWFIFDDGEQSKRTWIITRNSDGHYSGTANDIVGRAKGQQKGMALHWDYEMDLTVDNNMYRVVFDDWLYRIDENNVINRSVIKKWGFDVGEVILSIRKI
ncbi:DUF3833 domain-containing protein [Psychromonas sp. PT13]|uniref:DUF3833 domain-containing protein n=1 Tax=Psychromonas sp. PT13 TaxID=3439547 RepID=UPI003EBC82E2